MATKTLRVFAEYTSTGFVPMPTAGNIDYGYTLGSTFPATTPTSFQTDNPDLVVTVTAMTDFYVWIRINGTAWNPSYTRNVRVYPDSPNINNVVMNMIIATGPAGIGAYTQIVQTSNRLYFNGATTDAVYNSKFAGKTYINELNFGTAPGLATVATSGAYADLTGKPSLATVATSGLFTDLSSKPSGTAPLSYNSGTNSFVITQANTSTNGFLSSTDWNTFNNKFATPAGTTLQYVDGTGALQTFPLLASADKLVINVRNSSGVSMPKGSVVYINGATGNKPTVALAQANSDASSAQTLGLLQATLANNAEGNVVIVGSVIDLNTSAFTEGQQLYLSPTTAGAYTTTKPYAPNHLVYVGVVTRSHVSLGVIEVKVQNGYEMDELHNVSAQSPSNNDGLFYNTTTSLWEKKSIATVLGYTPYNGTDTSIKALFSASAPLSYSNGVYGISQATTSSNGYLSSADWNTFNGKESALTFSTPLVRTTNTISINQASASTSGFLSSTDWNTFNNKGSGSGSVTSVAMTVPTGLSISGTPITTSGTLALSLTAGYVIPTTSSASNWDSAYTNRISSLTVTGSSGTATLAANVLNIPSYTLVGLGGQPALNGTGFVKISGTTISYDNSTYLTTASASSTYQTIITNPVTGTGTINELAYFNTSSSIASLTTATYPSLTEISYVKGVTSAIQTQLNAKASTLSGTTNYIPKFTSSSAIGNSNIQDSGTALTFGVASTFTGNITISKSSPYINLNAPTGTSGQYNINNGVGDLMWAMYSVTGGGNSQSNWNLYSAGKTGGAGNVMEVTPAGAATFSSSVSSPSGFTAGSGTSLASIGAGSLGFYNAASSPKYIHLTDDATTINAVGFSKSGSVATTWFPSGSVGIQTSSPGLSLSVQGLYGLPPASGTQTSGIFRVQDSSSNISLDMGVIQYFGSWIQSINKANSSALTLALNPNGGNVAIGNTSPVTKLHVTGSTSTGGVVRFENNVNQADVNHGILNLVNTASYVSGNDASIMFSAKDSAGTIHPRASIGMKVSSSATSGDLVFNTRNDSTYAERTKITSAGVLEHRLDAYFGTGRGANDAGASTLHIQGSSSGSTSSQLNLTQVWNGNQYPIVFKNIANPSAGAASSLFTLSTTQYVGYLGVPVTTERLRVDGNSGNLSLGSTSDPGYRLYVAGTIYATGNITANSDLTLKKNLKLIDNPIDKLMSLNGYAYQWKSDDSHQYGVIAQEVEKILPYAVSTGYDGIKGVSYNQLTPLLIEGFKSHESEITQLKKKVKIQQAEIDILKSKLA